MESPHSQQVDFNKCRTTYNSFWLFSVPLSFQIYRSCLQIYKAINPDYYLRIAERDKTQLYGIKHLTSWAHLDLREKTSFLVVINTWMRRGDVGGETRLLHHQWHLRQKKWFRLTMTKDEGVNVTWRHYSAILLP